MHPRLVRAAAIAALTSALGYAIMGYRKLRARQQQKLDDKLALQDWETDGGGNLPARPSDADQATTAPRREAVERY